MPASIDKPLTAGIDLGGTHAQIGVADDDGNLLARDGIMTEAEKGHERVIERLAEAVRDVCEEAGVQLADLHAVGLGAPGNIDMSTGTVINAPNLGWKDVPAGGLLSDRLDGTEVRVDNDVNAAALGECLHGVGRGATHALGVWVGTGVGGGIVYNGKLLHGTFGSGGEIGQTVLFPDPPDSPLQGRIMERHASRHYMTQRIVERIKGGEASTLRDEAMEDGERITAEMLKEAWDASDALVREEISRGARYLGHSIANALTVVPLPIVILGGGLTEVFGKVYADLVSESIEANLFPKEGRDPIDVRQTELRENAGLLGACAIARQ